MMITPLRISGAFQVDIERAGDERGFFARCFCRDEWLALGVDFPIAQCSLSGNFRRRTLRGMHYQSAPYGETKLVRCSAGRVWDCIIDLRPQSPTYRTWEGIELSAENHRAVLIPERCAHGFFTLEDNSELFYMISGKYEPQAACGVRWNDPAFQIAWPAAPDIISERDQNFPDYKEEGA